MDNHEESIGRRRTPLTGELTGNNHRLEARVYYADTDFSGVVYHARYLEFLERGRVEYLRLVSEHLAGDDHSQVDSRLAWIVRRLQVDFRRPARIDELIIIETRTRNISGARVEMAQTIRRGGDVLIEAQVECALVNSDGQPQRLPKNWKDILLRRDEQS